MTPPQSFGPWLRARRRALDLTQDELARRAGCAPITIRKLEAEESRPSKQLAAILAEQLKIPTAEREEFIKFARAESKTAPLPQSTLPGEAAPWRAQPSEPIAAAPHNLPLQLTTFIGREREIADIKLLLTKSRLMTVTGAGGSGKTRLACEVSAQLLNRFPDGTWFVDLTPLSDPGLVPQAIASVLGVREEPHHALSTSLAEYLRDKKVLLLLDNCEHLIGACAGIAEALLRACPPLRILATSREPLGIVGENVFPIPTLELPPPALAIHFENLGRYEAVRLFVDRARMVQPGFELTEVNGPAVARICQELDGIPLAIELAAARVRALGVETLARRLGDRFHLLHGDSPTGVARHQTLRALIDWSYDLLSSKERVLLRRLSVFAGGWELEAAETVCADDRAVGLASKEGELGIGEVIDLLVELVDHSMIVPEGHEGHGRSMRYRMLETIRQYASEKLVEPEETAAVRNRHLDYFLKMAEEAEPKLKGVEQKVWLDRLDADHDNIRTALGRGIEQDAGAAARLAWALQWFWVMRGHMVEGREWTFRLLPHTEALGRTEGRAKALGSAGLMAFYVGPRTAALTCFEEELAIARELEETWWIAHALLGVGLSVDGKSGDLREARQMLQESEALFREVGDQWLLAANLNMLGCMVQEEGDLDAARAMFEESEAITRRIGDRYELSFSLIYAGDLARLQGDYLRAEQAYEEACRVAQELQDPRTIAKILSDMGLVALHRGDLRRARSIFEESLAGARQQAAKYPIAINMIGLAALVGAAGRYTEAARLFAASEAYNRSLEVPVDSPDRTEYERYLAYTRSQLDEPAFAKAWAEGQAMSLEQAIAYALKASSSL